MRAVKTKLAGKSFPRLQNRQCAENIRKQVSPNSSDVVLFIGASSIPLIFEFLSKPKKLIVIEENINILSELQRNMIENQRKDKIEIINSKFDSMALPFFNICIINTPFSVVTPILFKLILHKEPFKVAYAFCLKDLASTISAQPGDEKFSRVSLNMQLFCKTSTGSKISGKNFQPSIKADVTLLKVEKRKSSEKLIQKLNFDEWDGLTRICFNRKNKTLFSLFKKKTIREMLLENYKTYCKLNEIDFDENLDMKQTLEEILTNSNLLSARTKELHIEDYLKLLLEFNKKGIHFG